MNVVRAIRYLMVDSNLDHEDLSQVVEAIQALDKDMVTEVLSEMNIAEQAAKLRRDEEES
ncbi:MAG TPA: hypothetical protein DCQ33_04050 [Nitrospira sp.]|nr:hypothetical protein [Nitrospira sp.]